uniref:Uncharacterized protein n=1 Tax=Cucumis sativus TaxID=3659 RepID=A0A0A0LHK9_CUCSA
MIVGKSTLGDPFSMNKDHSVANFRPTTTILSMMKSRKQHSRRQHVMSDIGRCRRNYRHRETSSSEVTLRNVSLKC